jgi:hypothetical protein
MELSELTNKELKNILRQNNVKNYSKLNKKDLVKKVNQLIKEQNGGKKIYKLNELIGGISVLSNENRKAKIENEKNKSTIYSRESRGYQPPIINSSGTMVPPPLFQNEANNLRIQEEQRQLNAEKNQSLKNQIGIQKNNLGNNEQCKACTIL